MRARSLVSALLVLVAPFAAFSGEGDAPAAPPPEKPKAADASGKAAEVPKAGKDDKSGKDAKALASKKPADAAAPAALPILRPAPKDVDEAMRRLARVRVSVKFDETPFVDAVDYIRRVAGFNVMVSPVLQNKGLDGVRPITMTLNDVSLKQLTELVAQFSATKFKLEDGVLQFTTPEDARGKPILHIYTIGDLTMRLHNFPGPDVNLRPSGSDFEDEPESDVENAWSDPQKIVDMIQKTCAESSWGDKDVSISADENKLIVRQYPEVHREIARLIWMLRSAR